MMYDGWGSMGGGWFMGFGMLFWIVILVLIVVAIAGMFREPRHVEHHVQNHGQRPTPLDILKERFAKGEIDKDEFEERRKILEG